MRPAVCALSHADRAALETFLKPLADSSMFLRSNLRAAGLTHEGKPLQAEYVAVFDGESGNEELFALDLADLEMLHRESLDWVLEDEGQVVAYSAINARLPDAVQVGGVWTPPEWRGRGYGRAVVAGSLLDARAQGVGRAVLFAEREDAKRAYLGIGFRPVGRYGLLLF